MGNESDKKPQQLTINDPVDAATLKRIGEIQGRRFQVAEMLLDLEQEKVKILVEGRRLDDERARIFNQLLASRGLPPTIPVEVDPQTGKITMLKPNGQPMPTAPVAPPADGEAPNVSPGGPVAPQA